MATRYRDEKVGLDLGITWTLLKPRWDGFRLNPIFGLQNSLVA